LILVASFELTIAVDEKKGQVKGLLIHVSLSIGLSQKSALVSEAFIKSRNSLSASNRITSSGVPDLKGTFNSIFPSLLTLV